MENVNFVEITDDFSGITQDYVLINQEDGSVISMTKAVWDELQAKQTEGGLI